MGFTIKIQIFCDYFLKNKALLFFNSSSSITYILLNNSNIAYFFNKLNRTFILTGCREYL